MSSRPFAIIQWALSLGSCRVMEGAAGVAEACATGDRPFERDRRNGIEIPRLGYPRQ